MGGSCICCCLAEAQLRELDLIHRWLTETQTGLCLQSLEFKLPKKTHIHAGKQLRV